jgi:Fe-S-cluster containining protein
MMNYHKDLQRSKSNWERNLKLSRQLQKSKTKELDAIIHEQHQAAFKQVKCLDCANCCKTTSPIFRDVDIKRIASHLRTSQLDFVSKYLKIDEDNDYVLQESPCFFLQSDNTCAIYEVRPKACREYPHTDRKNMVQILNLTLKNSLICPAVARIFDHLSKKNKADI